MFDRSVGCGADASAASTGSDLITITARGGHTLVANDTRVSGIMWADRVHKAECPRVDYDVRE
jgi:hypothetical protein